MFDVDVILVVEPHALTNPCACADMELPWEPHTSSWPEENSLADLSAKSAENTNTEA
jgi:hypothetical protein